MSLFLIQQETKQRNDLNMPIKYPSKYAPKYYNPNWGMYDQKRVTWEYHYGVGNTTPRRDYGKTTSGKEISGTGNNQGKK